jgi:hypothetical protein
LATPVGKFFVMEGDAGSGMVSYPPYSSPSEMPSATESGEAVGISKLWVMPESTGPERHREPVTPWFVSTLCDCVMLNATAFQMEKAGTTGKGASATRDRLLTMAPIERFSSGKAARVTWMLRRG